MSGCGREALPDIREWLGGPLECLGVVRRPFQCPGVVGRHFGRSRSGQETLPNV